MTAEYRQIAESLSGEYVLDYVPKTRRERIQGWKCSLCEKLFTKSYNMMQRAKSCSCTGCLKGIRQLIDYQQLAERMEGEYLLETIPKDVKKVAEDAWKCKEGHVFSKSFVLVNKGKWCPKCSNVKVDITMYKELATKNEGEFILEKAPPKCNIKVEKGWKCKRGHIFDARYDYLARGHWCHECLKIDKKQAKTKCKHIGKIGDKKGVQCEKEAINDGYCGTHFNYYQKIKKQKEEREIKKNKQTSCGILTVKTDGQLMLGENTVVCRASDGKINLTQLCKAGKKQLQHWKENRKTKAFLEAFSASVGIPTDALLTYESGSNEERSTWGHPQIAINIAQWISPKFDVQVSKWIYELALTGKVELGQEKSQTELDINWKKKCRQLEGKCEDLEEKIENLDAKLNNKDVDIFKLNRKYERLKERRSWYKFKTDYCFYIVVNMNQLTPDYKFGITDNMNARLATYRTNAPYTKILYLVYVGQHELLERLIKWEYKVDIQPIDHEFIIKRDYMEVVERLEEIMTYHNMPFKVEENLNLYNRDIEDDFQNEVKGRLKSEN